MAASSKATLKWIIRERDPRTKKMVEERAGITPRFSKTTPQERYRNRKICESCYTAYKLRGGKYTYQEILEGK